MKNNIHMFNLFTVMKIEDQLSGDKSRSKRSSAGKKDDEKHWKQSWLYN